MPSRINIGPENGPYVAINEENGNLQLEDNSGNVVAEWDDGQSQWDFVENDISGVGAFDSESVTTEVSRTGTEPVHNVKFYGATGDGSTDDTNAINEAIDSAPSEGVVYFPRGSYRVTETITLQKDITIRFEGSFASENGDIIGPRITQADGDNVSPLVKTDEVRISGSIAVDGNDTNQTDDVFGVHIDQAFGPKRLDVYAVNCDTACRAENETETFPLSVFAGESGTALELGPNDGSRDPDQLEANVYGHNIRDHLVHATGTGTGEINAYGEQIDGVAVLVEAGNWTLKTPLLRGINDDCVRVTGGTASLYGGYLDGDSESFGAVFATSGSHHVIGTRIVGVDTGVRQRQDGSRVFCSGVEVTGYETAAFSARDDLSMTVHNPMTTDVIGGADMFRTRDGANITAHVSQEILTNPDFSTINVDDGYVYLISNEPYTTDERDSIPADENHVIRLLNIDESAEQIWDGSVWT